MKFYIDVKRRMPSKQTIMRINLTCLFLLISLVQVSASTFAQNISLSKKNISLRQLFQAIKIQSGYDVIYEPQELKKAKLVSINVTNTDLRKVLDEVFATQPLTYAIDEKTIVVRKREKGFFESLDPFMFIIDIKGKVIDEKGQALAGATVRLKNTPSKSVITNDKGEFTITGIEKGTVLVISFLGYKSQEVVVGSSSEISVRMEILSSALETVSISVINTGYQTLSKERATGSFNVISGEQLDKPTTNIAQRLIGTTSGMQARSMDVNGNPVFEIRGQTSLLANSQPLVVVDGFPVQGDFSTINPNTIESVTILKDAAAASIWGAKSANGVIVVITRKPNKDAGTKVSFSVFTQISDKVDLDYVNPLATSAQTIDYEMKSFGNWSARINTGSLATNANWAWSLGTTAMSEHNLGFISLAERNALLDKYRTLSNKDQIRNELLANPMVQQYNLNISGASAKMRNSMSLLFEDGQSNFKGTNNKKYLANYRTAVDVFKWMEFDFSAMLNYNKNRNNGVSLGDIQGLSPYEMLRNEDGSLTNIARYYTPIITRFVPTQLFPYNDWTYNPIQEIANREITVEQLNARLQTGLRFKIIKGLTLDSRIQYEQFNTLNRGYNNENTFAVRSAVNQAVTWDMATNKITLNLPKGGTLSQSRNKAVNYNFRNQLNFDHQFTDKHEISIVLGTEISSNVTETFGQPLTYGYNDQTLSVGTFPNGPGGTFFQIKNWMGTNQTFSYANTFLYRTERYSSLYSNASYSFNNKYVLTGSVRTDGSNLITDDPSFRYDPFWSVGLGWQASKENFIKNLTWIDRLQVTASYGYGGNVDRSTSFRPLINMGGTPNSYTGDVTATISSFGNPTLRWEKTGQWKLLADYSLFRGKLFGKLEVYNKQGRDLIASLSIPAINGTTSQRLNNAEMYNRGFELELGTTQNIARKVVWRGNMNFSFNRNRITKLFVANYASSTLVGGGSAAYVEGVDANSIWRFRYAGLENKQPMVYGPNGTKFDFGAFTPGDGRSYLLNMGSSVAPYTFGFINTFQIQDFNFSFILAGKFGHKFQRTGFNYPPTWQSRVLPNNKINEVINGDPSKIVPLPLNLIEERYYFWDRFHQNLSYLIEDASHIRLQEVNLSYNVPSRLVNKLKLNRIRAFAQANDLYTWVANNVGEDPQYPIGTLKPQPRISLGVNIDF